LDAKMMAMYGIWGGGFNQIFERIKLKVQIYGIDIVKVLKCKLEKRTKLTGSLKARCTH